MGKSFLENNKECSLSDLYNSQTTYGKIKLENGGLRVNESQINNFLSDSISIRRMGNKTIVSLELICDEFESTP